MGRVIPQRVFKKKLRNNLKKSSRNTSCDQMLSQKTGARQKVTRAQTSKTRFLEQLLSPSFKMASNTRLLTVFQK